MAAETFVFNIAKGRVAEFWNRVDSNDPSGSEIVIVPLSATGSAAQGQDFASLSTLLADANFDEQTATSWARKDLTDAETAAIAADNSGNKMQASVPTVTVCTPTAGAVTGFVICYDSTGSAADSALIPLTCHAKSLTGDGSAMVLDAGVFFEAT